ncbi:MAG TPA: MDR family MFS transporter [Baekduia sp.]|nr:MDR family MFS transporter [Baekduia sp.]
MKTASRPDPIAFAAIVLAMLPAVLDQTVLATALPTIATDLGRVTDISWVVTGYVIAAAATTPLWGKVGDRYGRRTVLQISLALFLTASALCGVAWDITSLVASRALQGVAAGGLMTLAMASVGDLVEPRERARYQGYIAAVFALATAIGPVAGGLLVDNASWRWVFYLNLPLGIAALGALAARVPAVPGSGETARLDYAGSALIAGATSALMFACIWGGDRFAWGSTEIVGLLATSAALAVALVFRERSAADPVVPVDLLRTRVVALSSAALFLTTAALFAITVFVPLVLQVGTGASPTQAGLLLIFAMAGITVSTNLVGRAIHKTGKYRRYPLIGLALMTVAMVWLAVTIEDTSRTSIAIGLTVFGLGFGMVGQVLITAVQNSTDRARLGVAMATTTFFRGLGGAIGAAVLGTIFAARAGLSPSPEAMVDAAQTVFIVATPLSAIAFVIAWLIEEMPLRAAQPAPQKAAPEGQRPTASAA